MNLYALTEFQILVFALILLRITAFVFSAAFFSQAVINLPLRILLSIMLALLLMPIANLEAVSPKELTENIMGNAAREILVGLIMGFLTRVFFFVVSMTGDLVSMALGLSSAQIFNPMMGSQGGIVEQFYVVLGGMLFLSLNGHHMLLNALAESFQIVKVAGPAISSKPFAEMASLGQELLLITIKMSAPVLIAIFITNVGLGLVSRAIPQMNIFVTSFPVTILLGIGVVIICLPLLFHEIGGVLNQTGEKLFLLMKSF